MLHQILINTPAYVWAILAFLLARGLAATREREVAASKLYIVPLVMLALSLHDIASRFIVGAGGGAALPLAAWAAGAAPALLLVRRFGADRVSPGAAAGSVRVRGSRAPLALMMAVFCTKYAVSVALAVLPQLRHDSVSVAAACILFGILNGCFLGRLARDLGALRSFPARAAAAAPA